MQVVTAVSEDIVDEFLLAAAIAELRGRKHWGDIALPFDEVEVDDWS
jgi:hypothetical protein